MVWHVRSVSGFGVRDPAIASVGNPLDPSGVSGVTDRLYLPPLVAIEDDLLRFIYSYSSVVDVAFTGTIAARREAGSRGTASFSLHGYLTPTLSGDFSGDGLVNAADYTVIRDQPLYWGSQDYAAYAANYGGASSDLPLAVPEPSTALLVVIGLVLCGSGKATVGKAKGRIEQTLGTRD